MRSRFAAVLIILSLFAVPSFAARRPASPGDPGSNEPTIIRVLKKIVRTFDEIIIPRP